MSKLFGLNKPNTNLRKNVFDLSEKTLFSQSAGMLVPCFQRELNPGEKVQLDMSMFVRTQPLNTAAYVRCKQYVHAFFVPYKQLWRGWDNFFYGVDYRTSTLEPKSTDGTTKYSMVPRFNLWHIIASLLEDGLLLENYGVTSTASQALSAKSYNDEHGYSHYRGISRLLDMLGYGFFTSSANPQADYSVVSSLSVLIDDYIDNIMEIKESVPPFVNLRGTRDLTPSERATLSEYQKEKKKRLTSLASEITKLVNRLKGLQLNVNPFRFLAYQKIYSDFYKRDDYEATYPEYFNIDDLSGDIKVTGDSVNRLRLLNMLRIRYRWLPKDYFTGVVPSELYGVGKSIDSIAKFAGLDNGKVLEDAVEFLKEDSSGYARGQSVSTKSIRAAFAIEKHLRLTRRAGGFDYISQTSAHFGFEPPKGRGEKVEFLGGYSGLINISEVVTTANGHLKGKADEVDNAAVGQIFGKGVGSVEGKSIEFTAKEHGILMCISSIVPELDYSAVGLNRFNAKFQRGDYFQPEFQDLGLQPVYSYELKNPMNNRQDASILGYAPRYAEYKTAYDTLHGEFRNGRTMASWSADSLLDYDTNTNTSGLRLNTLRINPKCLDRIMSVNFDGSEENDQFMVQGQFVCKVIRPMSITGQGL